MKLNVSRIFEGCFNLSEKRIVNIVTVDSDKISEIYKKSSQLVLNLFYI